MISIECPNCGYKNKLLDGDNDTTHEAHSVPVVAVGTVCSGKKICRSCHTIYEVQPAIDRVALVALQC